MRHGERALYDVAGKRGRTLRGVRVRRFGLLDPSGPVLYTDRAAMYFWTGRTRKGRKAEPYGSLLNLHASYQLEPD